MKLRPSLIRQHAQSGLTLVELSIALVLTGTVLAALSMTTRQSRLLFEEQDLKVQIDVRSNRAAATVTKSLLPANSGNLVPDLTPIADAPKPWSDRLTFRAFEDFDGTSVVWSADRQLRWELDPAEVRNGMDDDGDGLIDEGVLVWIEDEFGANSRRAVVASSVAELLEGEQFNGIDDNGNGLIDEAGAAFERDGNILTLHLTLEGMSPGGALVQHTRRVRVQLRN